MTRPYESGRHDPGVSPNPTLVAMRVTAVGIDADNPLLARASRVLERGATTGREYIIATARRRTAHDVVYATRPAGGTRHVFEGLRVEWLEVEQSEWEVVKVTAAVSGRIGWFHARTFTRAADGELSGNLVEAHLGTTADVDDAIVWDAASIEQSSNALTHFPLYNWARRVTTTEDGTPILLMPRSGQGLQRGRIVDLESDCANRVRVRPDGADADGSQDVYTYLAQPIESAVPIHKAGMATDDYVWFHLLRPAEDSSLGQGLIVSTDLQGIRIARDGEDVLQATYAINIHNDHSGRNDFAVNIEPGPCGGDGEANRTVSIEWLGIDAWRDQETVGADHVRRLNFASHAPPPEIYDPNQWAPVQWVVSAWPEEVAATVQAVYRRLSVLGCPYGSSGPVNAISFDRGLRTSLSDGVATVSVDIEGEVGGGIEVNETECGFGLRVKSKKVTVVTDILGASCSPDGNITIEFATADVCVLDIACEEAPA